MTNSDGAGSEFEQAAMNMQERFERCEEALRIALYHRDHWRQLEGERQQQLATANDRVHTLELALQVSRKQADEQGEQFRHAQSELAALRSAQSAVEAAAQRMTDQAAELDILRRDYDALRAQWEPIAALRHQWALTCIDGAPEERQLAAGLITACFHGNSLAQAFAPYREQIALRAQQSLEATPDDDRVGGSHSLVAANDQPGIRREEGGTEADAGSAHAISGGAPKSDPAVEQQGEPAQPWVVDVLFDEAFYLLEYPDVAAGAVDARQHYRIAGAQERRRPHALFDPQHYRAQLGAAEQIGDLAEHYLTRGFRTGLQPCAVFDEKWYRETYAVGSDEAGLVHYLKEGAWHGNWPNPAFNPEAYRRRHPDSAGSDLTPIEHFLQHKHAQFLAMGPFWDLEDYAANQDFLTRLATIVNGRS